MAGARAVVIPFGVPAEGRGLGLGLAAMVHSFTLVDHHTVALAHLLARRADDATGAVAGGPVEAFVSPQAWRDLAGSGNAPPDVTTVLTGALEPPSSGRGMIQLLAFDARDGATRAKVELHMDGPGAGATLRSALGEIWSHVGGDLGLFGEIGDLSWDALESVLRGERCLLHDPARNGPHDRLAAMLHLGRAVGDAPEARFPAGRLAAIALESAMTPASDKRLADAALRALTRAAEDAPAQVELLEATAALHVRIGDAAEAESRASSAIEIAPDRPRLYVVLSEARRAQGDLAGALRAVDAGLARVREDAVLTTERGVVLAEQGDVAGAERVWRAVLARTPESPAAFANLASLAMSRKDAELAQSLVDRALAARGAHPEMLRRAIHLSFSTEAEGVPRAARVAALAGALVELVPVDPWPCLMLARAAVQMGDKARALEQLGRVVSLAPESVLAAEATRGTFALTDPQAAMEVDAILRASQAASPTELEVLAGRARRIATTHTVWSTWFTVGVVERRRQSWHAAREALQRAVALSPGATPAHGELVETCIALDDPVAALHHAGRASELDGQNPRTLGAVASALLASDRLGEAEAVIAAALRLDPEDARNAALAAKIREPPAPPLGLFARWRRLFTRG